MKILYGANVGELDLDAIYRTVVGANGNPMPVAFGVLTLRIRRTGAVAGGARLTNVELRQLGHEALRIADVIEEHDRRWLSLGAANKEDDDD